MLSRRDLIGKTAQAYALSGLAPLTSFLAPVEVDAVRCLNVINFMRGVEPREVTDLLLPVTKQMEIILHYKLTATWLLQYDALASGPYVDYLKAHMAKDHEVGFWFEMNEMLVKAAGVEWRGRPGFEWDSHPPVAFTIGYTEAERVKLVDAAMNGFKEKFGHYPASVASWNLDSISMAYMSDKYKVDAFAVCRDQIATDGFTIWGAPFAGYYPSKTNCWSPALSRNNQIDTPVLKMLGQDPVYYYENRFPLPDGKIVGEPNTMEPVWTSGRSPVFVKNFYDMIAVAPCEQFAYAQLGQENNFGWPSMEQAYRPQMEALAKLRDAGGVHVETMGETGRRFKKSFTVTPIQAQVQLQDPFGNTERPEKSIWYQSRFYRANLHVKGDLPYLRDLTVYSDHFPQPFLTKATRDESVEQRMPAALDGYHWSTHRDSLEEIGAGGFFVIDGKRVHLIGDPTVKEEGKTLVAELPIATGTLRLKFEEREIAIELSSNEKFSIVFEWDPQHATLKSVEPKKANFHWQGLDYSVQVGRGHATATPNGWTVQGERSIRLTPAQPA